MYQDGLLQHLGITQLENGLSVWELYPSEIVLSI
nr:Uncharacterised protein [Raoultella sp. NCTC 9187]